MTDPNGGSLRQKSVGKYAYLAGVCILFLMIAAGLKMWTDPGNRLLRRNKEPLVQSGFLFDTVISVSLYDNQKQEILDGAFSLCRRYEDICSPSRRDSELFRMNHRGAGVTVWKTDSELPDIVRLGLEYSEKTDGAFDLTVQPLSELWDFRSGKAQVPEEGKIREAVKKIDYRRVSVEQGCIRFQDDQTQIDIGAVAKGFIADRIKEYLLSQGVGSAIINLGGNVLCVGEKPGGEAFQIAIRKPERESSEVVKRLSVRDQSVVTSGIYERCFDLNGVHYHHILDPKTGMPYQNGLSSVTIVGPSSGICDALSTSCFSLGEEKGMKLLDGTDGYYGYMIRLDGSIRASAGAPE